MEIELLREGQNLLLSCDIPWYRDDLNRRIIPKLSKVPIELQLKGIAEGEVIKRTAGGSSVLSKEILDEFELKLYNGVMNFIDKYPPKYNLKGAEDYPIITDYTKIRV